VRCRPTHQAGTTTFGAECFIYGTREIMHRPSRLKSAPMLALALMPVLAAQAEDKPWMELGRQGLTRIVIVPLAQAADREAYARQLLRLCPGTDSCFINFYTNSRGVELAVPLPDEVATEATAVYRRSAKQGAELMRFSCRLQLDTVACF